MQGRHYTAQARIALRDPDPVIAEFCEHMTEHNAVVSAGPTGPLLRMGGISAQFSRAGGETVVEVAAPDLEGLYLASAGSHPGGGISGLPGRNAARHILSRRAA